MLTLLVGILFTSCNQDEETPNPDWASVMIGSYSGTLTQDDGVDTFTDNVTWSVTKVTDKQIVLTSDGESVSINLLDRFTSGSEDIITLGFPTQSVNGVDYEGVLINYGGRALNGAYEVNSKRLILAYASDDGIDVIGFNLDGRKQ